MQINGMDRLQELAQGIGSGNHSSEISKQSQEWDQEQANKIAMLWTAMLALFAGKWESQQGLMTDSSGQATANFLEWYAATKDLTDKQWKYGLERVDMKYRADIAHQREPWPPSTPKMFHVMCFPPKSEIDSCAGQAAGSRKVHPNLIARDKSDRLAIEDSGFKERKKKAGNEALNNLKGIFE